MPYALSWRARRDIGRLAADLARDRGVSVADEMLDHLQTTFDRLGEHPMSGRDRSGDLGAGRRSSVSGRNIVIHRILGRSVLIERVVDGRRDYPSLFRP